MKSQLKQLVLASGNAGKLREFQTLLSNVGFEVLPQSHFDIPDAEETGLSFVENAIIKARHAAKISGLPALADDSGIEVDALNGQPGIYSARFSGEGATDECNNALLLEKLTGIPSQQRTARYQCVLVFMRHWQDPVPLIAQGSWEGTILDAPRGENGFGYDPLFWVESHNMSSAEMKKENKNAISHRAKAMQQLLQQLTSQQS